MATKPLVPRLKAIWSLPVQTNKQTKQTNIQPKQKQQQQQKERKSLPLDHQLATGSPRVAARKGTMAVIGYHRCWQTHWEPLSKQVFLPLCHTALAGAE